MIYTHVLKVAGGGVRSPLDVLGASLDMALDGALARQLSDHGATDAGADGNDEPERQHGPQAGWPGTARWPQARMPLGRYIVAAHAG
jgi:hypothetical protein